MKATVYFEATVAFAIEVEVPDETEDYEREALARDLAYEAYETGAGPTQLCHHCSSRYDMGEFEIPEKNAVQFEDSK